MKYRSPSQVPNINRAALDRMNTNQELLAKPRFTSAQAEAIAEKHFNITASATELTGERDQNFLLTTQRHQFVLKIANSQAELKLLELENAAMGIVATIDSIESPVVNKSSSGSTIVSIADATGQIFFTRLLSFVPGATLAEFRPHSKELLMAIGRSLGEIDLKLASLNFNRVAKRQFYWDLAQGPEIVRKSLPLFSQAEEKTQLLNQVLGWHDQIAARLVDLPHSVIHNDANDHNLLVQLDVQTGLAIPGLVDFGDIVYSATVNELAICALYVALGKTRPLEAVQALACGYHQSRRLSEDEISVLFPLICLRLAQSVCISAAQHELRPDDKYLTVSEQPAWQTLQKFILLDPRDVHLRLSTACAKTSREKRQSLSQASPCSEATEIEALRDQFLAPSLRLSYDRPLHIVRGRGQYLFDQSDMTYLDCVNNVCHVGHCHPHVVRAAASQLGILNTNTRYLHENIVRYAKRLTETLPPPLEVCFLVNSGSEANDLALRLARTATGHQDIVVIDRAYHGHTSSLIEISPYKFTRQGGRGKPDHVHILPCPDGYRGAYTYADPNYGEEYVSDARQQIDEIFRSGRSIAAFFAESFQGCGGQIQLPPGYLAGVYAEIKSRGGVCVADEVQVGFGRVGTHFWGFETQSVIPDIVTMGKPIGNGHPLAAVVTTREIADAFDNGMEYFNTFGGNPVSSAIGLAVLEIIENEELQKHALETGNFLLQNLNTLKERFSSIGDIRGSGLFLGIELSDDGKPEKPDSQLAYQLIERLKDRRILLSTDGPDNNVIKFKPPMVFSRADAERLSTVMGREFERLEKEMG